ncbi:MAG: HEAT repeat domain-containing protein, partial [Opitutales bacterium]|nr:HEAT repeat domain-containing protein [Opitutales bacterium]
MNTPEKGATMADLRNGHEAGTLPPAAEYFFSPTKPVEELYDTRVDPHELENLADDSRYESVLVRMRKAHLQWVKDTKDTGLLAEPILVEREKEYGSRYAILRETKDTTLSNRVADAAAAASSGEEALPDLIEAMKDKDAAVRYWGAVGIGNIGKSASSKASLMKKALKDESSVVRIAAARALGRMGQEKGALPVLAKELKNGEQWERLHAAIVLDEMDDQARPALAAMHAALEPREELYANGKYVVRVINRALNQLEGTNRKVP